MLDGAAFTLNLTRQRVYDSLKDISQEQWLAQPAGFANNIAWNVGHLVVAQQALVYMRAGIRPLIAKEKLLAMRPMFANGTSPESWESTPDKAELLSLFISGAEKMSEDIQAGLFDDYVMPAESNAPYGPAPSLGHLFLLNQSHEGFHGGCISNLLSFVG